ncbi:MAG: hypothetical protein AAFN81_32745, partial [Bacteroidota bacterium]
LIGWDRDFVEGYSKDVPLSVIVNAHSIFRRVCFGYGIPLDYRDWTPLGFLKKCGLDEYSWGYA